MLARTEASGSTLDATRRSPGLGPSPRERRLNAEASISGRVGGGRVDTLGGMDIGDFYDRDPRRRGSDEVVLGTEWLDGDGSQWRVAWLRDTGELFAMPQHFDL